MVQLTVNSITVEAPQDSSVLQAAESAGITIPTLCYHPDLSAVGSCRLCLVEEQHFDHPMAACKLPAVAGMVVRTRTPQIEQERRMIARELHDETVQSLIALDKPPYYAVKLYPTMVNTQGGPKRNAKCQVVDPYNQPIPGLYSAGELGSFWGWMYNGGGNNAEALCTGRIAVRNMISKQSG